jgi:glycerophosphoryl diester phosphodiesterase
VTKVIAHRGATRLARENTVAAFRSAVEVGADAVELDVRRLADGSLAVHHDPVLADGRQLVALRRDQVPADVPTLTAALDACAGAVVNVEIKNLPSEPDFDPDDAVAAEVVAVVTGRAEPRDRWLVSSFRREAIDRCRALDPAIPTAWLTLAPVSDDDIAWARAAGHTAIHPWDPTVDRSVIERCHAAGLAVNTWTCNDVGRALDLAAWGIDGICTDVADELIAALRR